MGEEAGTIRDPSVPYNFQHFPQSVVRREFDEDTGRVRLIKGDGEVLEECVSRF